tara:strand:- start:62 stop:232 length:171 start_codon:yes stop_codon:yes gene_type:complete
MRINVEEIVIRREPPKKVKKLTPEPKVEVKSDIEPEPQAPVRRNQKWFDEQKRLRQ